MHTSEVGGSEFAFRQAPPVTGKSFRFVRACMQWNARWKWRQNLILHSFPFAFSHLGLSLFPCEIYPFSLEPSEV